MNGEVEWLGLCPFHQDKKTANLTVSDRKGFYHCFACQAHGDILDWWVRIDNLSLPEAIEKLKREAGSAPSPRDRVRTTRSVEEQRNRELALSIWQEAGSISGTVGETYLRRARCISISLPEDGLRFHPALPTDGEKWPAIVAAVRNLFGDLLAIQRTFLEPDGSGKASISGPKRCLGSLGSGAVRLGAPQPTLGLAEGIETGLSAMEIYSLPVWCILGSNFARIELPGHVRDIVIFADRGEAGEEAAAKAKIAFRERGRRVAVRFSRTGKDFNDELRDRQHGH